MSRATKGWVAISVLVLLLVGAGIGIARSVPARIRFLAWRARSADPEVRRKARIELMNIGRPTIDPVIVDIFLLEVRERRTPYSRIVLLRRVEGKGVQDYQEPHDDRSVHAEAYSVDEIAEAFQSLPGKRRVVLLTPGDGKPPARIIGLVVAISCPVDDGTEGRLRAELPEIFAPR